LATKPSVLVVEDEPSIAELIAVNLRHSGFEVTVVHECVAAQHFIDTALPDLLLLDWMLPGQSGESLTRRLRANDRTSDLPIVLLTARGDEADKVAGLNAGADDYVTKPFSTQ
jgi:two-component system phosphate regulon response regulator PhoB